MARLGDTFDPNEVPEDDRSFDPMPAGDYICQIVESDVVETSKGGDMLKLTLEVIEGPFEHRKVWDNLNIRNSNPDAQRIAHRTLADICEAVGLGPITDSDELHYLPLCCTLKIEPEREVNGKTYDARNAVKRYKPRDAAKVNDAKAGQAAGKSGQASSQGSKASSSSQSNGATRSSGGGGGGQSSRPWGNKGKQPEHAARVELDDNIPF